MVFTAKRSKKKCSNSKECKVDLINSEKLAKEYVLIKNQISFDSNNLKKN